MWKVNDVFGKPFFVAGLMPALVWIAAIDFILVRRYFSGVTLASYEFLEIKGAFYIVGGIFAGFLLLALNTPIIKSYEHGFLFSRWLRRRCQQRHQQYYTALIAQREAYRQAAGEGKDRELAIARLEAVHKKLEALENPPGLPVHVENVMPTALGNAFAVMEEYSYDRYGMDAMVYWPRLTSVIPDHYQKQITDLKITLDFLLNLSLLTGIIGVSTVITGVWFRAVLELTLGASALVIAYGLYRIAVSTVREMGVVVMSCFDLFRRALWEKYDFPTPDDLQEERRQWLLMASFINRGEEFYFPQAGSSK